ncbi:hypothetical protein D5086_007613 [Populus alba]|uniref:Uncharacterized protein n=1 Tax=Populus alba TaxID=43335 RepID=A0ACC4CPA1_POPAL
MDDGEVEVSDHVLLPDPGASGSLQCSGSVDSLLDELLKNTRTCTHTHTCNPPGPDAIHTHTCYHTHTQVIASEEDDNPDNREHSRKRPAGNREAVRKACNGHDGSLRAICLSSSITRVKDNIYTRVEKMKTLMAESGDSNGRYSTALNFNYIQHSEAHRAEIRMKQWTIGMEGDSKQIDGITDGIRAVNVTI